MTVENLEPKQNSTTTQQNVNNVCIDVIEKMDDNDETEDIENIIDIPKLRDILYKEIEKKYNLKSKLNELQMNNGQHSKAIGHLVEHAVRVKLKQKHGDDWIRGFYADDMFGLLRLSLHKKRYARFTQHKQKARIHNRYVHNSCEKSASETLLDRCIELGTLDSLYQWLECIFNERLSTHPIAKQYMTRIDDVKRKYSSDYDIYSNLANTHIGFMIVSVLCFRGYCSYSEEDKSWCSKEILESMENQHIPLVLDEIECDIRGDRKFMEGSGSVSRHFVEVGEIKSSADEKEWKKGLKQLCVRLCIVSHVLNLIEGGRCDISLNGKLCIPTYILSGDDEVLRKREERLDTEWNRLKELLKWPSDDIKERITYELNFECDER